jgi:hypothetical protein
MFLEQIEVSRGRVCVCVCGGGGGGERGWGSAPGQGEDSRHLTRVYAAMLGSPTQELKSESV